MEYVVKVYVKDKRKKTGERLDTTVEVNTDEASLQADIAKNFTNPKHRVEYYPKYKTVKSLMTGQDIVIPTDTPYCCDPSTERYWSM